jgi:hypothetical protein
MDLTKTMICPKCGNVVMVTDQFCSKCGERLKSPSFWRRLGKWFQSVSKPNPPSPARTHTLVLKKDVTLETIDKQSVKHVYHSLDEVPPEIRGVFEKLESELKLPDVSKDVLQPGTIVRESFQEFRFKDAFGKEQVYHSIDEMPPETRALFEKMRGRLNLPE